MSEVRVGLGMGMTISTRQYENVKPQVYIEKTKPEGMDEEEFIEDLYAQVEEEFEEMLAVCLEKMKELVDA